MNDQKLVNVEPPLTQEEEEILNPPADNEPSSEDLGQYLKWLSEE